MGKRNKRDGRRDGMNKAMLSVKAVNRQERYK
jgi:hypothetical protein